MPPKYVEQIKSSSKLGEWRDEAACLTSNEDFFPSPYDTESVTRALAVCAECVVQQVCLEYALDFGENFGVWGGMPEDERRTLRRRRRKSNHSPKT